MVDSTAAYDRGMDTSNLSSMNGERAMADRVPRSTGQGFEEVERSGPEHVSALLKMGAAKQDAGDYSEAEDLFRRALELGERVLGPDNPALVAALTNLAGARILSGRPESAEPLVIRALSMTENGMGEYDPDFGMLVNDLARLCLKHSAHAVAEPLLLRLLAMKRNKGDDHPEVGTVLASLAAVRQALGRHESAEQLWRRVLDIRERTLAPNHVGLATALERLAESCSARGKIGEALGLLQRALTIRELTLGVGNPSLRVSRDRIADLQLQASEDDMDGSSLESPPPAPDRFRLLAADHSAQSVSKPVQERIPSKVRTDKAVTQPRKVAAPAPVIATPVIAQPVIAAPVVVPAPVIAAPAVVPAPEVPAPVVPEPVTAASVMSAPVIEEAPSKNEVAVPLPLSFEPDNSEYVESPSQVTVDRYIADDVESSQPALMNYRDVILSIQQDLEDDENAPPKAIDRFKEVAGTIAMAVKHRQKEIAVVVGAVVLVAGLTTASQALIKSQQAASAVQATPLAINGQSIVPSATAGVAQNPALAIDRPKAPAVASAEATPVAPSRARVVEQRTPAKKADSRDTKAIAIPTMSSTVMAGFDSVVRAHTNAPRLVSEPLAVALPPANGEAAAIVSSAREVQTALPQRARLIGKLPAPHYPEQLIDVQGDVRVRFEVDAAGKPVMSSLAVLSSSNEFFTASVFKVIPGLRFVPAASGGTDSKPTTDVVQLGFAFRPAK
jgi:tetratricopeptide (TPR) repeat protein